MNSPRAIVKDGRFLCLKCQQPLGFGDLESPTENGLLGSCRTAGCPYNPETPPRQLASSADHCDAGIDGSMSLAKVKRRFNGASRG